MSTFCSNCGNKLEPGVKFCAQCGKTVNASAPAFQPAPPVAQPVTPAAQAAPPVPQSVPPASGGGAIKVILVICAVIAFFMLLAAGSCFYVAYRVKQRAHEFAGSYQPYRGRRDACALVTKDEVSQAFRMPVESVTGSESNCQFQLSGVNSPVVALNVTWQGGAMVMKLSHGAMKQIGGIDTYTPVPGLGDEAYIEPMGSGLMVRKNDVLVMIDLRTAGNNADAAKIIAAKIVNRL